MTKYFVDDWNSVWKNVPVEHGLASEADTFLLWQDITPEYVDFITRVQEMGKKVIVLQHGRRCTIDYLPPASHKPYADKILVWSEKEKRNLESVGYDKAVVVGCPVFQSLTPRVPHEGFNVVFCPIHLSREYNENLLVTKELRKLPKEYKVTSKLLTVHLESSYDNPVVSGHRDEDLLEKVAGVLATADVVVGIEDGTFELLAMSLDIPVLIVDVMGEFEYGGRSYGKGGLTNLIAEGCKITTLDKLNEEIQHAVEHPEELREERKQTCIDDGGLGLDAINNIMKEII